MMSETDLKSLNFKLAKCFLAYRTLHTQPLESRHPSCFFGRKTTHSTGSDLSIQVNKRQIAQSVAKGGLGT